MQIDYLNNKDTTLFQQIISCNLMKFLNVKQVSNAQAEIHLNNANKGINQPYAKNVIQKIILCCNSMGNAAYVKINGFTK